MVCLSTSYNIQGCVVLGSMMDGWMVYDVCLIMMIALRCILLDSFLKCTIHYASGMWESLRPRRKTEMTSDL
jgi:hypothetical protein